MQVASSPEPFDAIVVGSGATGGWAAKKLTAAGMRVALLEAGAKVTPRDFTEHTQTWQMPFLGYSPEIRKTRPIQGLCYACRETNHKWFVNDLENPYTQEKPFLWIRMRVLGGRSLSWGRQSYRMSDLDFKAATHDGYGDNWPISYAELVPVLRRGRALCGHQRNRGELAAAARQHLPARHADDLRGGVVQIGDSIENGTSHDYRSRRGPDQSPQRPAAVPLLWSLRAGLQHVLVLQQPFHYH